MMQLPKSLTIYWFLLILSLFLLGSAYFFEYVRHLAPCPLCISQRVVVAIIGILSLLVILFRPRIGALRIYGMILFFIGLLGIFLASRQIYFEYIPASSSQVCLPGVSYLIEVLPWQEALKTMLTGGPECGKVSWTFLYLSMAEWLCAIFIITAIIGFLEVIRKHSVYKE